jgi:hypothetical protein
MKEVKIIKDSKLNKLIKELSKEENFGSLTAEDQLIILVVFEKALGIDLLKEFEKIGVYYG